MIPEYETFDPQRLKDLLALALTAPATDLPEAGRKQVAEWPAVPSAKDVDRILSMPLSRPARLVFLDIRDQVNLYADT